MSPLRRTPLKRGKPLNRVNRKRRQSEFARCYHSKERVEFVKALPCIVCGHGPCDNAHIETDGMGRKADYTKIVPLCRAHHSRYDQRQAPFSGDALDRPLIEAYAADTEARWLAFLEQQDTQEEVA